MLPQMEGSIFCIHNVGIVMRIHNVGIVKFDIIEVHVHNNEKKNVDLENMKCWTSACIAIYFP